MSGLVEFFLKDVRFFDIFFAFCTATLLFAAKCEKREKFWWRVAICFVVIRAICYLFAYTYDGTTLQEALLTAVVLSLMIASFMFCFKENFWNMIFYFGAGFMSWYISDRTCLIAATLAQQSPTLSNFFIEGTLPHMLVYAGIFILAYTIIYLTLGKQFRRFQNSKIAPANSILLVLVVCILTPIFYFESEVMAGYNTFYYLLLSAGEIFYYVSMLIVQIVILKSAKERARFDTQQKLWLLEQKQFSLIKENIDAINLKCHDLKHQVKNLRESGQVEGKYLDELEKSISIYNSAVHTGNETLDIILTDKRLHCVSNGIQITCMADAHQLDFLDVVDIYSLFGNALDNAIESELKVEQDKRFIHISVRPTDRILSIHIENYCDEQLVFEGGLPVTTKEDRYYHGYGMKSIKRIVDKYKGNVSASVSDELFQLNIVFPIPK